MFVPRASPEREADQRAVAPVCLAYRRSALPESGPLRLDFEEPADPCPRFFLPGPGLPNPCDPEPQSQGWRRGARAPIPLCAHNAHLWPWSTLEHSSPIEDACTSSWESHRWVLRRGFSSSRTSRADASVVSNGPTRDLTPARDGLVIARTQPRGRRATKEESTPASADVLTVRLPASQSSPVTSNEQM